MLALADYEKHSLVRGGVSHVALNLPEVSDGMTFIDLLHFSRAGEECSSSQVVQLFCYLCDSSSELTVPLRC